jgi:hypothetical protein
MWVSDRVRGHSAITTDDLPRIAAALSLSVCDFFPESPTNDSAEPHDLESEYDRAVLFAQEMATAWPTLDKPEQELLTAVARAAATAAATAVLTVLQREKDTE